MLPGFVIGLREGIEAALILGVTFGILAKIGRRDLHTTIWSGVIVALVLSIFIAMGLQWIGASLQGASEAIFEGALMVLAAIVLTWMIFWMQRHSRDYQTGLEEDLRAASKQSHRWALFSIALVAVVREGIETSLFLTAAGMVSDQGEVFLGALLGLTAAMLLGWMLYNATIRLNLRLFFQFTSVLLILFAAGLFAHGVHEFVEVGWFPAFIDPLWNLNPVLDEGSVVGTMLKALFGYNGDPSLTESIAYVGYLAAIGIGIRWIAQDRSRPPQPN